MKVKKLLCLLLAALMLVSCLASCAKDEEEVLSETEAATTAAETEAPKRTWNDLEKIDMGGEEFTILTREKYNGYQNPREWDAEGLTGEIIPDAVFARNSMVEEAYSCKITQVCDADLMETATAAYLSDTSDDYDMIYYTVGGTMTKLSLNGFSADLASIESIDINDTWYDQQLNDSVALAGRYYSLSGDAGLYDDTSTFTVLFNKTISREYQFEDHYEAMLAGDWTYEFMYGNAKKIASASTDNPNEVKWGIGIIESFGWTTLVSAGSLSFEYNTEDDTLTNMMKTSNYIEDVFKVYDYWKDNNVTYVGTDAWQNEGYEGCVSTGTVYGGFAKGKSLYCTTVIAALVTNTGSIYNSEEAFGMLPIPKLDESQEDYTSVVDPGIGGLLILNGHSDKVKVGHILTAMNAASSTTLVPAFYEQTLERRAIPDEESLVTLELILNDRISDMGYIMSVGVRQTLRYTFGDRDGSCNYESLRKKYADSVETTIDELMAAIKTDFATPETEG